MFTFLSVALVVAAVHFIVMPRIDRALGLSERRIAVEREATVRPALVDASPMPPDMKEWCLNESTKWAQEDKERRMYELHGKLHDWEKVRKAIMAEDDSAIADARSTF